MELFSRTVAALLLIILSPFFLLIGAGSLLFQGFPVLFKQERVGFKYNLFKLYKFRTMKNNRDEKFITETGDGRITGWGKLLRKLKFDELPQLWNIIKGDMRFIGPRPEVFHYVNKKDFSFLNSVKPGLTDFSSILLRNEEQIIVHLGGVENYPELLKIKVRLGQLYANQKGFKLDLMLVFFTLLAIVIPSAAQKLIIKIFIIPNDLYISHQIKKLNLL
jgi:lipopolysaccharide/colanic/teichoic acid biosynthesis glycosyltransferase